MSTLLLQAAAKRGLPVSPAPPDTVALGELAASVFLCPLRATRRMPREIAYLETAQRFALPTSAGKLAAWQWGPPTAPLVGLLHCWEGNGAQLGAFADPLVTAGFRVITFDAPGHGDSPGGETSAPAIGRLIAEMEEQTGRFFALVGHSMGAASATMAVRQGVRPSRMVFLAPPLSQLDSVKRFAAGMKLEPGAQTEFVAAVERRTGVSYALADMMTMATTGPCPLLAFHDPGDREARYSATMEFVAAWRAARLVPCPGRGHYRIITTPEVVRQSVEFIAGRIQPDSR